MRRIVCVLGFLLLAGIALAHDPKMSGITILGQRDRGYLVSISTHLSRLAGAEGVTTSSLHREQVAQDLEHRLDLVVDGIRPDWDKKFLVWDKNADMAVLQLTHTRTMGKSFQVNRKLLPEDPAATTIVNLVTEGRLIGQAVLDANHSKAVVGQSAPKVQTNITFQYLIMGIEHILTGYDHIAFLLGLLIMGGSMKSIVKTVTFFTFAHSVSLAMAATGFIHVPSRIVEPLIAFSILVVAMEAARQRGATSRRPYYAFGFGLIHGVGFAGALGEVGLPQGAIGNALVSFNIGVEVGQLGIILLVFPILSWLANRRPPVLTIVRRLSSGGVAVMGIFLLGARLAGFSI